MKTKATLLALFFTSLFFSQTSINGRVIDHKNSPISGANVYLEGTYDGGSTDENGAFLFSTDAKGEHVLIVSFLTFETFKQVSDVSAMKNLNIQLKEDVNTLDAVVLSAGSFAAGDNSKISVLKPLDVVTTASALGDFVGALQTLPGTTTVAEDGRLFVRGGDAEETQIFIDGLRVFTPYLPTTNNVPTRGRYSPFLFDGITFSTGGYSAEYGQALSSVLLLNTIDEPDQEKTDVGVMSVGLSLGNTQKWAKSSLSINTSYINLAPYVALFPDKNEWDKPFEGKAGEAVYRRKFTNGLLKFYSAFDQTNFELTQEDINVEEGIHFNFNNRNFYLNGSYQGILNNTWSFFSGLSYTYGKNDLSLSESEIDNSENSIHLKLKLKKRFNSRIKLILGSEYFSTDFTENFENDFVENTDYGFQNNIAAVYTEADVFFSKKMALKAGMRAEYSQLFDDFSFSPRISFAYKTNDVSQISLAYGDFFQNPINEVLKFDQNVDKQSTKHFILNYQFNEEGRIFRAETYYKSYKDLIKYDTEFIDFNSNFSNNGEGFATGLDLFWRDSKSINNIDYWLSYSYLDTERDYQNFPQKAQPNFANKHNLNIVGKYWLESWKSQFGFSYTFSSGRSYSDPNIQGFLNQKTKAFNSLSLNLAYLISPQKILYLSVNNVLNQKNINGYQFKNTADSNGMYESRALRPAADQFFFIGFFWTISEDKSTNQLDNL